MYTKKYILGMIEIDGLEYTFLKHLDVDKIEDKTLRFAIKRFQKANDDIKQILKEYDK